MRILTFIHDFAHQVEKNTNDAEITWFFANLEFKYFESIMIKNAKHNVKMWNDSDNIVIEDVAKYISMQQRVKFDKDSELLIGAGIINDKPNDIPIIQFVFNNPDGYVCFNIIDNVEIKYNKKIINQIGDKTEILKLLINLLINAKNPALT